MAATIRPPTRAVIVLLLVKMEPGVPPPGTVKLFSLHLTMRSHNGTTGAISREVSTRTS